jgi:uncharacterized protein (TIGR03435 family)
MRKLTIGILFAAMGWSAADEPKFEVASVKKAARCTLDNSQDPGTLVMKGDPLRIILMKAFDVKIDRISGPDWMDDECYDVFAKIPEGATREQVPAMLRALLAERLKLSAHTEKKPAPAYALVVDKGGPKMKEASENSTFMGSHLGAVGIYRSSMAQAGTKGVMTMKALAGYLTGALLNPVQDETGLTGKYEVDLTWTRTPGVDKAPGAFARASADAQAQTGAGNSDAPDPGLTVFTALRDNLGLRLEPRKGEIETVVIDHVERIPIEN